MANVLDYDNLVTEFELKSRYYVHFWTNILAKGKSKLVTIVEGDQKAPFSIATTLMCRGGRYSIPWITPRYSWSLPYNAEC